MRYSYWAAVLCSCTVQLYCTAGISGHHQTVGTTGYQASILGIIGQWAPLDIVHPYWAPADSGHRWAPVGQRVNESI